MMKEAGVGCRLEQVFEGPFWVQLLGLISSAGWVSHKMDASVHKGRRTAWELVGFFPPCITQSLDTCNLSGLCQVLYK